MDKAGKRIIKLFVSIGLSALIVFFLLRQISLTEIWQVLAAVKIQILAIGLLFYLIMILLRASRFEVFFRKEISWRQLLVIANLHNFFNEFLPFRSGELVYLYLIKQARIEGPRNLSSLIIIRLMDFVTVIIVSLSALWLLLRRGEALVGVANYAWLLPIILIVGLIFFILFIKYFHRLLNWLFKIFRRFSKLKAKLQWVEQKAEELTSVLRQIWTKEFSFKLISRSLLLWLTVILTYYFILHALSLDISLLQVALVILFPAIITVIPVQGAAGVGTYEAAIGLGLVSVGFPLVTAISTSFALHVIIWIFAILTGLIGFLIKKY